MKRITKNSILSTICGAIFLFSPVSNAAFLPADILWVVDVSASMGGDIAQVRNRINQFNTAMTGNSIDAHYGLIEFGGNVQGTNDWRIIRDMASFAGFPAALNQLVANHGNPESGSSAGLFGLNNITFRNGAVKNIILVTDEDDDSDGQSSNASHTCTGGNRPQCDAFNTALGNANALFNVIRSPNAGNTANTYDFLAANHGGTAFNILSFRSNPTQFFDNFVATKVQEIKDQAMPEPTVVALMAMGLLGLGFARRRARP